MIDIPEQDTPAVEEDPQVRFARRDAETQLALGIFVTMLAVPVLIGTYWAEKLNAQIVNAVSGLVLLGVGLGMAIYGVVRLKRVKRQEKGEK